MDKQYKISQAKDIPGRDKPIWLTHGRAFEKPDGRIRLKLDSIPIPNADGEIWLNLFEINEEESDAGKDKLSGFDEPETGDDDIHF